MNKSVVFRKNTEKLVCLIFVINSHAHMASFYSNISVAHGDNLSLCTELSFKIIVVMNARIAEQYQNSTFTRRNCCVHDSVCSVESYLSRFLYRWF